MVIIIIIPDEKGCTIPLKACQPTASIMSTYLQTEVNDHPVCFGVSPKSLAFCNKIIATNQ